MKATPQFVNGYKAPRYFAKVPLNRPLKRLLWWAFRRYLLNEDYYKVVIRFTGPRPKGTSQVSTTKPNATALRYYVEPRSRQSWNH